MREMLAARDDRDFVIAGPRSAPARPVSRRDPGAMQVRRPKPNAVVVAVAAAAGAVRRRFGLMAGIGLVAVGGIAVCVNALSLQNGRHPAPIFAPTDPARPVRVQRPAEPAKPATPVQLAAPSAPAAAPVVQTGSIPTPPAPPRRVADAAPKAPARDAIGEMIRATDPAAPAGRADRSVAFAQRALTKLGYGQIKADGVMGAGTRAALERFERDQKIAVTGEASGRTLRDLAQRSGLAQE